MATAVNHSNQAEWAIMPSSGDPSNASFSGTSEAFEPVSDTVGPNQVIAPSDAMMASRFQNIDRSRIISDEVSGQLVFEASPVNLGQFLDYITGDNSSPHTLQQATCLDFDFMRNEGGTNWEFRNCFVQTATFSPTAGKVRMALDVLGKTYAIDASFANAASQWDAHDEPYTDYEVTIELGGLGQVFCESWQLSISQGIDLMRRQSRTFNRTMLGVATVTLNANIEWTAANEAGLYAQGKDGIEAIVTFQRTGTPAVSTVFTMPTLVIPDSPVGLDGGEILWNFTGVAREDRDTPTSILSIAHDDNPA